MEAWSEPEPGSEGEAINGKDILTIFKRILDYQTTKHVLDLFDNIKVFLRVSETMLPHGARPSDKGIDQSKNKWNVEQTLLKQARVQNLHEVRERTGRMAGWELVSANLIEKGAAAMEELALPKNGKPEIFWIRQRHPLHRTTDTPQILLWKDKVVYVMSVLGVSNKASQAKQKSRLQISPWLAEHTKKIFVIEASEFRDKKSGARVFRFQSSQDLSPTHIVQTKKAVTEALLQLQVDTLNENQNGMALTLTQDSLVEMLARRAKYAEKEFKKLEEQTAKAVSEGGKIYASKTAPIQFIEDFQFHELAFNFAPLTTKGSAAVRSGLKYLEALRQKDLQTTINEINDEIMLAWPGYCYQHFYMKGWDKHYTVAQYRQGVFFLYYCLWLVVVSWFEQKCVATHAC